ncbi:MAG TPA: DUF3828 domain-containing protein [Pyrinomonadaceae bacterium]|nr:DUF3828 domain-containing protein [Pyrinomonadaceae bacterium]
MKKVVSGQRSAVSWRKVVFYCLPLAAYCLLSCSVPNLEKPECSQARQTVKELYSYHFGGDMKFTRENLAAREKFLSRELLENLAEKDESATDYFTRTDDYPKTFRVGECRIIEPEKRVNFGVVLFWKTDTRSEQKEVRVEVLKENDKWSVDKVGN